MHKPLVPIELALETEFAPVMEAARSALSKKTQENGKILSGKTSAYQTKNPSIHVLTRFERS